MHMNHLANRLRDAAGALPPGPVPLAALAEAHGGAWQASLLVLLSAPCLLPIPGVGSVLSLGLALLAAMLWLWPHEALPPRLARVHLPREGAARSLDLLARFYDRLQPMTRSRWTPLAGRTARWWLAPLTLAMAVLIFLPIPFGNLLPAVSLMLAGVALLARDGVLMLGAVGVAAGALASSATFLALGWQAGAALLGWA
ncbi:exopolysaccharide biosynthesis protein [Roseateles sp. BYS87W]|uniref:Exopolysaccharide biosynthesis protein n=1 Tax=Pelomonas baiyunensis TaxID=3299026 RepID=A0ABW7H0E1_9BURK